MTLSGETLANATVFFFKGSYQNALMTLNHSQTRHLDGSPPAGYVSLSSKAVFSVSLSSPMGLHLLF